jgi:hypothetical protein
MFAPIVPYSSEIQQPMRATSALGKHPHTHWTAPSNSNQGRAGSLHPEGQCSVDQTWTEREVYSGSSQLSTPPTYELRSREFIRKSRPSGMTRRWDAANCTKFRS